MSKPEPNRKTNKSVVRGATDWGDDSEVGQVAAPSTGVVTQDHVSFLKAVPQRPDLWTHRDHRIHQ